MNWSKKVLSYTEEKKKKRCKTIDIALDISVQRVALKALYNAFI